ncbi:MAG: hypothetical protein ACXQS2_06075 [Methermicoccaceae archaeon]
MNNKYENSKEFLDPVVRCTECQKLLFREWIKKEGKCRFCGNRRVRSVSALKGEEMAWLSSKGVDKEFLALFEEVPDA